MSEQPKAFVGFVSAGHEVLFQDTEVRRCDVCSGQVGPGSKDPDEAGSDAGDASESPYSDPYSGPYSGGGCGLLVWARGDERRYQEPPLCAACAAAIGVTALQRWETEEDEG